MQTSNYYVATDRYQPTQVLVFGLLDGRSISIDSIISIGKGDFNMPLADRTHFYVEVGTHPMLAHYGTKLGDELVGKNK